MLSHICIYKKEYKTCIQELCNENTICNLREHLRLGIISNRGDELDNQGFKNQVESNNDEGNHLTKDLRGNQIREVNLAECFGLSIKSVFSHLYFLAFMSTETLHNLGIHGFSIGLFQLMVDKIFPERLLLPVLHIKNCF